MYTTTSNVKFKQIEYVKLPNGNVDVWLHKNIRQISNGGLESELPIYEADEVYLNLPSSVTEGIILTNFDFYFNYEKYTQLQKAIMLKKIEIGKECKERIHTGFDVELSTGIEHFTLNSEDQMNLTELYRRVEKGDEKIEYHQSTTPTSFCKYYSNSEMSKIIEFSKYFVSFHTTYCNSLYVYLDNLTDMEQLNSIRYGIEIPEAYQSEVLRDYLKINNLFG